MTAELDFARDRDKDRGNLPCLAFNDAGQDQRPKAKLLGFVGCGLQSQAIVAYQHISDTSEDGISGLGGFGSAFFETGTNGGRNAFTQSVFVEDADGCRECAV